MEWIPIKENKKKYNYSGPQYLKVKDTEQIHDLLSDKKILNHFQHAKFIYSYIIYSWDEADFSEFEPKGSQPIWPCAPKATFSFSDYV